MASKPKKADLLEKCAELGIEASDKMTVTELMAALEGGAPREMTVKCDGFIGVNVRKAASPNAPVTGVLPAGSKVAVGSVSDGWAEVDGGYCMAKYLV